MMLIYLDVCCLNRPFDDREHERVRLEAEAVLAVLTQIEQGVAIGCYSPMHADEISNILNPERRYLVELLAKTLAENITNGEKVASRANELEAMGFHPENAQHLAFAEAAHCDVFLTTDDRLERRAIRLASNLEVRILNPTAFVMQGSST